MDHKEVSNYLQYKTFRGSLKDETYAYPVTMSFYPNYDKKDMFAVLYLHTPSFYNTDASNFNKIFLNVRFVTHDEINNYLTQQIYSDCIFMKWEEVDSNNLFSSGHFEAVLYLEDFYIIAIFINKESNIQYNASFTYCSAFPLKSGCFDFN